MEKKGAVKDMRQMTEEIIFYFRKRHFPTAFLADGRHTHPEQSAGIDPGKGGKIKVDIERQAVKGYAVANGDADAAEFLLTCPNPVIAGIAVGDNAACRSEADHYLF